MKAVILAGGKGTRMKRLTETTPKPLLPVLGRSLLEYKLDMLPDGVTEIIIVVGYHGTAIMAHVGGTYRGIPVTYAVQEELNGTGGALWLAKDRLDGKFIVMMGDDIYSKDDVDAIAQEEWAVLATRVSGTGEVPASGGRIVLDEHGSILRIVEGRHEGDVLLNTGLMTLGPDIFGYGLERIPGTDEYGLTLTVAKAAADRPIRVIESSHWIQVSSPEDIARAEAELSALYGRSYAADLTDSAI